MELDDMLKGIDSDPAHVMKMLFIEQVKIISAVTRALCPRDAEQLRQVIQHLEDEAALIQTPDSLARPTLEAIAQSLRKSLDTP